MSMRQALLQELSPLRPRAAESHPWRASLETDGQGPGAQSRWSRGKDLSWQPLRPERVCEVRYDHLQGARFRHATTFLRWRPDKPPADCRYDQLEITTPYELARVFGA
jgi:ATP-dependent DNA ligase